MEELPDDKNHIDYRERAAKLLGEFVTGFGGKPSIIFTRLTEKKRTPEGKVFSLLDNHETFPDELIAQTATYACNAIANIDADLTQPDSTQRSAHDLQISRGLVVKALGVLTPRLKQIQQNYEHSMLAYEYNTEIYNERLAKAAEMMASHTGAPVDMDKLKKKMPPPVQPVMLLDESTLATLIMVTAEATQKAMMPATDELTDIPTSGLSISF